MKDLYNTTEKEVYTLSQNYNITDLAYGNIKGKGSLKLRKIENRLKAIQYLAKDSIASDIKLAYNILENKSKSKYWRYLMNDTSRNLSNDNINTTKRILEVYLNQYISGKNERVEVASPVNKNLETLAEGNHGGILAKIGAGKTIIPTITLLATLGFGIVTGMGIKGCYDNRILKERESRIEQLVKENKRLKTRPSSEEIDKRYEKYATDEKAGRLLELDLTQAKEQNIGKEDVEYYTNKRCNKRVFVQGYMYATNKMQVPPEFDEQELKERERLQKKWTNIDEKVKRDTKKIGDGLHDLATFKHPISGLLRAISGFGGVLNASARGFVRPITYLFTRNDTIDKVIDDFGDASYFGDSYNELHGKVLGLKFNETEKFLQEHPVKSTISIAEDIFLWKLLHGHGDEGGAAISRGGSVSGIPGRSGGAGTP